MQIGFIFKKIISAEKQFSSLWDIMEIGLLLSHGQARVEGGFSINKQTSIQNLNHDTLVALRFIGETIRVDCGNSVTKYTITKQLMRSVNISSMRYKDSYNNSELI